MIYSCMLVTAIIGQTGSDSENCLNSFGCKTNLMVIVINQYWFAGVKGSRPSSLLSITTLKMSLLYSDWVEDAIRLTMASNRICSCLQFVLITLFHNGLWIVRLCFISSFYMLIEETFLLPYDYWRISMHFLFPNVIKCLLFNCACIKRIL